MKAKWTVLKKAIPALVAGKYYRIKFEWEGWGGARDEEETALWTGTEFKCISGF